MGATGTVRWAELAWLFLRLGLTAFGGPAAHIAMMQQEVVHNRKWLSQEEFMDLLGATNLIPGPNSTEMAIHIGYRRSGWLGLFVAGISFITPAFLIVLAIAFMSGSALAIFRFKTNSFWLILGWWHTRFPTHR
jgi:chromate transporter